jgi:hypothetical protein
VELEAAAQHGPGSRRTSLTYLGFDNISGGALARTLWLLGHPAQAEERARQAVEDAASAGHPVSLSVSLIWAISVFLWTGDLQSTEQHLDWFSSHAESHSLGPYIALALQQCLEELHAARYEVSHDA